ncbi:hypothetical protein [Streptacidiphilus sp. MAP5-3]|uniref:hypothetical protein n=1 Tax=unclassified Streptacidiphilus TaxID=2643834 RepID=UPI003514EB0F
MMTHPTPAPTGTPAELVFHHDSSEWRVVEPVERGEVLRHAETRRGLAFLDFTTAYAAWLEVLGGRTLVLPLAART